MLIKQNMLFHRNMWLNDQLKQSKSVIAAVDRLGISTQHKLQRLLSSTGKIFTANDFVKK